MAIVQVRDVPDDVAQVIAEKARAQHKSVSAYLRDLMSADVKQELQRRALADWNDKLRELQCDRGIVSTQDRSGVEAVRETRAEYDS